MTSVNSAERHYTPPTYGNWWVPRTLGLGKLSLGQSFGLLAVAGVVFVVLLNGHLMAAFVVAVVSGLFFYLVTLTDRHRVSVAAKIGERANFMIREWNGGNVFSRRSLSRPHLPGSLERTTITAHTDSYDRPFAIIHHKGGTCTVVFSASPAASNLVDNIDIDHQVAAWGMWLGDLGRMLNVVGAQVSVETLPDSGVRLKREVEGRLHPSASDLSLDIISRIVSAYGIGASQVRTHIALTFRDSKDSGYEIGIQLPSITNSLQATGAGTIIPLGVDAVSRLSRCAFDPAAEEIFDAAFARREETPLEWLEAGPQEARASWDSYRHDSGLSRSWVVSTPPQGTVTSDVLTHVLSPSGDIERKRVTLIYQTISVDKAPGEIQKDLRWAKSRAVANRGESIEDSLEYQAARQVALERAKGAGLVNFGMIITGSTMSADPDEFRRMTHSIESLSAASQLLVRPAYGRQEEAFIMALPLGVLPKNGGWA